MALLAEILHSFVHAFHYQFGVVGVLPEPVRLTSVYFGLCVG